MHVFIAQTDIYVQPSIGKNDATISQMLFSKWNYLKQPVILLSSLLPIDWVLIMLCVSVMNHDDAVTW